MSPVNAVRSGRHVRIAFLALAAIVALECLAVFSAAFMLQDGARVINVSGLARMHSQRIAFLAATAHAGTAEPGWRAEIDDSIAGIAAADAEATRSPYLADVLPPVERAELDGHIERYVRAARSVERDPSDSAAFAEIVALRPGVLAALRHVVNLRTALVTERNTSLAGAIAAGLVLDTALIFWLWFRVIVPAQRSLIADFAHVNAERVQLRSIFNENPDAIAVYDAQNILIASNAARCALFGARGEDMLGKPLAAFVAPARLHEIEADFERAKTGEPIAKEIQLRDERGTLIDVDVSVFPLVVDGGIRGTIVASRDIRELKAAKRRSDELAGRLKALHEISSAHGGDWREQVADALRLVAAQLRFDHGVVAEIDADGRHVTLLMSTGDPTGWPVGRSVPIETTLTPQIVRTAEVWTIDDIARSPWRDYNARNGTAWQSLAAIAIRIGGAVCGTLALTSSQPRSEPLSHVDRDFVKVVAVLVASLIDRGRQTEALRSMAHTDELTGLPNRAAIAAHLDTLVADAALANDTFAIHFIDLDRFKAINDSAGHEVGDAALREVAHRLRTSVRTGDVVGRLGGDEFVVLQAGATLTDGVGELADRIIDTVTAPMTIGGAVFGVGCSIGISLYPADGIDGATLMRRADEAMYRSKADRRSQPAYATA